MRKIVKTFKHYPLTAVVVVVIWVLCFIDVPETPLDNVTLIDKWTHIAMYLFLGLVVGAEWWRANKTAALGRLSLRV